MLAGTIIALVGFLPGYELRGWREKTGAAGACFIGGGTALSFLGSADHLSRTDIDILNWGLLGVALLLIVLVLAPYLAPRFCLGTRLRLRKNHHAGDEHGEPDNPEDSEDHTAIYAMAYKHAVEEGEEYERANANKVRGKTAPPLTEPHKPIH